MIDYNLSIWCLMERWFHIFPVEVVARKVVLPRGQWLHMNLESSPFFIKWFQTWDLPRGKYQSSSPSCISQHSHLWSRSVEYDEVILIWCLTMRCLDRVAVALFGEYSVLQWLHMISAVPNFFMKCFHTSEWPRGTNQSPSPSCIKRFRVIYHHSWFWY